MKIKGVIEVSIRNQDGSLQDRKFYPVKSFVIGFIKALAMRMSYDWYDAFGPTYVNSIKWTAGGTTNHPNGHKYLLTIMNGPVNMGGVADDNTGIVVGTSTTAVTADDTQLATKILHGVGAGQLQYATNDWDAVTTVGNVSTFAIKRVFTNNSGAPITVNEVGLHLTGQFTTTTRILGIRDIISGGRTLNNTQSMEVKYKLSIAA